MSKKTFRSVATTFFSNANQEKEAPQVKAGKAKAGQVAEKQQRKPQPAAQPATTQAAQEVKARRVQLLMKPSTYELAKEAAYKLRLSFNEYIHLLIEEKNK